MFMYFTSSTRKPIQYSSAWSRFAPLQVTLSSYSICKCLPVACNQLQCYNHTRGPNGTIPLLLLKELGHMGLWNRKHVSTQYLPTVWNDQTNWWQFLMSKIFTPYQALRTFSLIELSVIDVESLQNCSSCYLYSFVARTAASLTGK